MIIIEQSGIQAEITYKLFHLNNQLTNYHSGGGKISCRERDLGYNRWPNVSIYILNIIQILLILDMVLRYP